MNVAHGHENKDYHPQTQTQKSHWWWSRWYDSGVNVFFLGQCVNNTARDILKKSNTHILNAREFTAKCRRWLTLNIIFDDKKRVSPEEHLSMFFRMDSCSIKSRNHANFFLVWCFFFLHKTGSDGIFCVLLLLLRNLLFDWFQLNARIKHFFFSNQGQTVCKLWYL